MKTTLRCLECRLVFSGARRSSILAWGMLTGGKSSVELFPPISLRFVGSVFLGGDHLAPHRAGQAITKGKPLY